jgi:hypothetical protein
MQAISLALSSEDEVETSSVALSKRRDKIGKIPATLYNVSLV